MAGVPVETLSRVPLFEGLDASELQWIADSMHEANVPAGATVTAEGGPGDGFFVIDRGMAAALVMFVFAASGRELRHFNEIALGLVFLTAALICQFTAITHTTIGR